MKKYLIFLSLIFFSISFSSCIKQIDKTFSGTPVAEFDAAALNPVTSPFTHPLLIQVPKNAVPVTLLTNNCSNSSIVEPFIKRTTGTVNLRINVVGPVSKTGRDIDVTTFPVAAQLPSLTFRQPSPCTNVTLTTVDAVQGTDYTLGSAKITVPADSSFGYLTVNILNAGPTAGQARVIGFELKETATLKPSQNYKRIAIAIDQR